MSRRVPPISWWLRSRDETRVGLGHLAFAVADRAEVDAWERWLAAAAVVHSSARIAR